jgi:2-(1,2-epoxy-1,2-dihydrophenyl)acetyl-CoA isomerase
MADVSYSDGSVAEERAAAQGRRLHGDIELVEVQTQDALATITLNRPEQLNALAGTMREDLLAAIQELSGQEEVRAILLTGAGRGFCAGGDLGRLRELREAEQTEELARLLDLGRQIVLAIRRCPKPVLAVVNGPAAGAGLALALACDLRIAAESARFVAAFGKIGLVPDWGCTWLLARTIGTAPALELAWSGRRVGAAEALALGLVHRVVPDAELGAESRRWAHELVLATPFVLGRIKEMVYRAPEASLANQLAEESRTQLECFRRPETLELLRRPD